MTADLYLAEGADVQPTALISHMVTAHTEELRARGVDPAVCYSVESPLTAKRFYHNLRTLVAPFRHAFLFAGGAPRLQGLPTTYHPLRIAMDRRERQPLVPWDERDLLVLINSNKRAGSIEPGLTWRKQWAAEAIYWGLLGRSDPLLRGRELYGERLAAIEYFARYADFHLYGYGWEHPVHRAGAALQPLCAALIVAQSHPA